MADVDSLIVTFQTQLSDVMESVVKTAMYEVTRLVEDGLLEQLKARNQEVEALRIRLQWAEKNLTEQGAREAESTASVGAVVVVEPGRNEVDGSKEQSALSRGHMDDSDRHKIKSEEARKADTAADSFSPVWTPQAKADDHHVKLIEDIKKEAVLPMSCSSLNSEEWGPTLGDVQPKPHIESVRNEMQEDLLRHIVQRDLDPLISAKYVVSYGQQDTNNVAPTTHIKALENNTKWLHVASTTENDCENVSSQKTTKELESVVAKPQGTSSSPRQSGDIFGVSVKQEVITDSEELETISANKPMSITVRPTYSKQHRTGTPKQNRISHKAFMQIVKSKVGTSFRPLSLHHVQRPIKRPQAIQTNGSAELANTHSQVANSLHRTPSTSNASPPLSLSVQRARSVDKPVLNRSGAPWINIKASQLSSNSPHTNPSLNVDLHLDGPRQIFRCGQCGKCFPHPSNLKSHLLTHTGERPFCCSLCGRTFTKLSNLKAHRRVHTGERPYSCLSCGKRFTQNCNLKRHQRIHLDG